MPAVTLLQSPRIRLELESNSQSNCSSSILKCCLKLQIEPTGSNLLKSIKAKYNCTSGPFQIKSVKCISIFQQHISFYQILYYWLKDKYHVGSTNGGLKFCKNLGSITSYASRIQYSCWPVLRQHISKLILETMQCFLLKRRLYYSEFRCLGPKTIEMENNFQMIGINMFSLTLSSFGAFFTTTSFPPKF